MNPLAIFAGPYGLLIKWLVIGAMVAAGMVTGFCIGKKYEGETFANYKAAQATQALVVVQGRERLVHEVQIEYVPRIKTIEVKGDTIIQEAKNYVTQADDTGCRVSVGFVREYNAAWAGEPAGPAGEPDRGPSGVPLSDVAETDAHNAKSCRIYKEQRDGLIDFYTRLQALKP